jgi:GT2 family glycosyltransferase
MNEENGSDILVSFIITAFKTDYLKEAIDSIFDQIGISSFEIVVVDDSPAAIVEGFVRSYNSDFIKYVRPEQQLGGIIALDYGLRISKGKYVKFLNDDDVLNRNCAAELINALEESGAKLASSRRTLINEKGEPLPDQLFSIFPFDSDVVIDGNSLLQTIRRYPINFIGEPSTVLFRRLDLQEKFPHISSLNTRLITSVNDLALFSNLLEVGDLVFLEEPLSQFRMHGSQTQKQGSGAVLGNRGRSVLLAQLDARIGGSLYDDCKVEYWPLRAGRQHSRRVSLIDFFQRAGGLSEKAISEYSFIGPRDIALKAGASEGLNLWLGRRSMSRSLSSGVKSKIKDQSLCLILVDENPETYNLSISIEAFRVARYYCPGLKCVAVTRDASAYSPEIYQDIQFVERAGDELANSINHVVSNIESDWVVISHAPTEMLCQGAMVLLSELQGVPESVKAVYCDELIDRNGSIQSGLFRPGLNLDMLISCPADLSRHWVFERKYLQSVGGFKSGTGDALDFDLILRTVESEGMGAVGRLDEPLFLLRPDQQYYRLESYIGALEQHLSRRGYAHPKIVSGGEPGTLRVQYQHEYSPLVSIIIPTKDQLHLLQTCVESLLERTSYPNYELLIVDNDSKAPEAVAWLQGLEEMAVPNIRVLRYRKPFNFSAINNYAVSEAKGEYVLLLNNDTGIIRHDWLDALMNHAQRPEVGIVGPKLLFPDGSVQHAGVILGMRGPAEHICIGMPADSSGYMNRLQVDQNYTAVTAACMLVRKSVYQQVGGLDEDAFAVSYNDIDFCLKVAQAGFLTVWTPYSVVMHVANASQTSVDKTADAKKIARFRREQDLMYERWLPYMGCDPAFNRNLSLRAAGFEVEQRAELNWQPQKLLNLPTVLVHPADQWGCGHYRIMQPLESMKAQAVAGGMIAKEWLTVPEMARLDPDAFVYQRQITPEAVENMKYARRFLKKPIVYELDDYLPNLPIKSAYRKNMPKDILKSLRASLKHVDRFVVSTHPLADAFKGAHPDIRVVENRLPLNWWADLSAARRQSEKPRVGWAGGVGHTGDLELVEAVVRDLADEVDWVFFGMCPEGLRPYVKEVHEGVNIELYPEKLASMNLDLAIAPLEDNLFNRCKSNLRLLEYGACGFPVVCSDVEPYRAHELPVTRVKNRYKDWVDAIRMHLSDLDETARNGDELREVVRRDWMLEGENLQQWLRAWTKF